jgi:hypothetical protein
MKAIVTAFWHFDSVLNQSSNNSFSCIFTTEMKNVMTAFSAVLQQLI